MGKKQDGKRGGSPEGKEMTRITAMDIYDSGLDRYLREPEGGTWERVLGGYWRQDIYHGGWVEYYVRNAAPGTWVLKSSQRSEILDDLTEEDVEAGRLNDDQAQALWDTTLEEARNSVFEQVVAVIVGAPETFTARDAARELYRTVRNNNGPIVSEPEDGGLLS